MELGFVPATPKHLNLPRFQTICVHYLLHVVILPGILFTRHEHTPVAAFTSTATYRLKVYVLPHIKHVSAQ